MNLALAGTVNHEQNLNYRQNHHHKWAIEFWQNNVSISLAKAVRHTLATTGNNVIFDHIIETELWMGNLIQLLADLDVFFVGLHCSLPELERRERQRGNRRTGEVRADFQTVHNFTSYDLELNSENSAEENAKILIAAWKKRKHPTAFDKMAQAIDIER